jgi:hypothetical protein
VWERSVTNDRYVKNYCKENGIEFLDMEEILRAMKLKKILNPEELRKLIEDIEKKDHTIINRTYAINLGYCKILIIPPFSSE